ncbi:3-carboxy-cis,cis-muconate cycloisomerase [Prauserella marina]|uniref:3-carboxy-cis,cis-muconate cycloisomerase n=1 Tax=Prauserella marina TaxID=530584 RepID=A0A222VMP2_9PSEU|nr:adenylosuccinate lyase family protein [Prauserella marina]ASR35122.1 3-carboxy-cis,cis-muconate cycloisomerase [Prauserella marina]PWV85123.1 3-carboxy-cis,cis-muconate cycloisomerase [Prauserella marina]SDC04249.1 3-carboxy-cis,cis-muconate cycloisomerase [Prauserella marina]
MSELFDSVLAAGPVAETTSDPAWLQAMLDVEAALASAQADVGLIEREHADAIGAACVAESYDVAELGRAATGIGNPAGPLVRALTERVGGAAARHVHSGATSQDVLDSAAMLVAKRSIASLLGDVRAAGDAAAALASDHIATVQVGRTLSQHALPVTFGLVAAGWLSALGNAEESLASVRLPVQLGGAAGTLASLGSEGPAVASAMAARLGLAEPVLPWHTDRTTIARLAGALGETAGAVSGIARTVVLLAQTDVGEVVEQGPEGSGGSSTMPHKRNPVAAVAALASAKRAPGLVADLLAAMEQEHQRAAGAWHAEWLPLTDLLRGTGSAAHWLRTSLGRLRADPARMRANLDSGRGLLLAERVTTELAPSVGRLAAHDAVTACCARAVADGTPLADVLEADPLVGKQLSAGRITELLDPAGYLGSAEEFVRRVLAAHREKTGEATP